MRWPLRLTAALAAILMAGAALAQQCTYELEPNDSPAEATVITGEGPDAVAAAASGAVGTACLSGEMLGSDQDAFAWVIDEAAAAQTWRIEVEGPSGGLTQVDLVNVQFAENGEDVVSADRLFRFGTTDGSQAVSDPFVVAPGRLVLGLSQASAPGTYVVNLRPTHLEDGSNAFREGRAIAGGFDVFAPLTAGLEVPFTVAAEDAAFVWGLSLLAPLGSSPTLALLGPGGEVTVLRFSGHAPVRLSNLGLEPGEYVARVAPGSADESGFVRIAVEKQGRASDGTEVEPNDEWESATRLPLAAEVSGAAEGRDYYRIDVPEDEAGTAWDLRLEAGGNITLQLYHPDGSLLQERSGSSGISPALTVEAGAYRLIVSGRDDTSYDLSLTSATPAAEGFEREPNDQLSGATPLGAEAQARGELRAQDVDHFRLDVEGAAQRYRLQVVGRGVEEIGVYNAAGQRQASVSGEGRIRLDDVVLLPGTHYVRVAGAEGEYAVRALSLGPAPEPVAAEDAPQREEAIPPVSAPVGDEVVTDQPLEAAVDEPATAALPPLPPPPPGVLELEPNDDSSRAVRLLPGAVHVGRLAAASDEDRFRFFLAADQYVRLELVPAVADEGWSLAVDGRNYYPTPAEAAGRIVVERWLLAGDHELLTAGRWLDEALSDYYQLRITTLGSLDLPVDLEPNDSPEQASRLPAELEWQGRVGEARDSDVYLLPRFANDTDLRLEASAGAEVTFDVVEEGRSRRFVEDGDALAISLPADTQTYLRVRGGGDYRASVSFGAAPAAAMLLPARDGDGLNLRFTLEADEATAFWHEGQRVTGTVAITSSLAESVNVALTSATDNAKARVVLPDEVEVGPGETALVPVSLELPSDMLEGSPLLVEVAVSGAGSSAAAEARIGLRCEASPLDPFPYWPLPEPLIGRPNVLLAGLGAKLQDGLEAYNRHLRLVDGRTSVATGGYVDADRTPTFELAGDAPVTLVGTVLNPLSDASVQDQLRRFRIETSVDGVTFETAFEGELGAVRVDQSFVFDQPVAARFVRLVAIDSHRGRDSGYLGEWMVIAEDPAVFSGADLALPSLGGHVVRSEPLLSRQGWVDLLSHGGSSASLDMRSQEDLELVVGFDHGRAGLFSHFAWTQPEQQSDQLFDRVEIAVSSTGAAGPWEVLGEWPLEVAAGALSEFELDEPVWARYVRFNAPKPASDVRNFYAPEKLAAYEAEVASGAASTSSPGYRSALAAWGTSSRLGPYEWTFGFQGGVGSESESPNDSAEQATALATGEPVTGTVAVAEDVDWYRVSVPAGENHFELRLSGDPSIAFRYELTTEDGSAVDAEVKEDGNDVVLSAFVEPGDYLLKLDEPKRTVVFAWDTSGSVSPYQAITYSSLASFARGVDGEREAVQLLAYNDPAPIWLLPIWSHDTERVQRALSEFERNAESSNSEIALLTATNALASREGTTAVLLITDAESPGHEFIPSLWRALEAVKPRVFTFEISSGGSDYSQDLMQDWAAVNAGTYDMAQGVSTFEAGFDRASCHLRRPKRYTVALNTTYVAPPGPGTLTVEQAPGAAQGAVEVIFDASGSMGQVLPSGEQRIDAAKRALQTLVGEVLPDGTPFALRAFGHIEPSSCETRLDVGLGPLDRDAALAAVRAIEPKLLSQTAIADSLVAAVDDLTSAIGSRTLILITDGEESCGGDPAAAAAALRETGSVAIAIVSLALEPDALAVFETLAEEIDASFVDVGSYEALSAAIAEALVPAFEVFDTAGERVARGRVGDSIELPMGTYSVHVLSEPVVVIEGVRVPGDGSVRVAAGSP